MLTPNGRRFVVAALALLAVFGGFASAVSGDAAASTACFETPVEFRLRTTEGGEISSEQLRGDVVVMAFGAAWLPLSRAQVQGVQKVADQYGERNVRVYWVSTDSDSPKSKNYATDGQLREFASRNGLKVAVLRDPGGMLLKQLRIDQLPAIVILDRAGNLSGSPIGGLDRDGKLADIIAPRLDRLLNN